MALILDRRDGITEPACHAFIVGVSGYPHLPGGTGVATSAPTFGLQPLSSAAVSARSIYTWLTLTDAQLAKPLATVRLLLSPGAHDERDEQAQPATLDNFIADATDWRQDAAGNPENMTFFYFAGNGFSVSQGDHVLVLQDFGDGRGSALRHTVRTNNIVDGMGPTAMEGMARTQLYFIDANRWRPEQLQAYRSLQSTAVFDVPIKDVDDRSTAIFYATSPGSDAYAYKGQPTFFSRALIDSLSGAAAVPADQGWAVSVQSLYQTLPNAVQGLASEAGVTQQVVAEGSLRDSVIAHLTVPPQVDLTIQIEPSTGVTPQRMRLVNDQGEPIHVWEPVDPVSVRRVPAGLYQVDIEGVREGEVVRSRKLMQARGPSSHFLVKLTP